MPFSYTEYTGDGSTTDFAITFPYLDASHVFVTVNGLDTTNGASLHSFTFVNATTVRVVLSADGTSAVGSGDTIRVGRNTGINTPPVNWAEGAALTTTDLNKLSNYLTYALQESLDANEGAALATLAQTAAEAAQALAEAARDAAQASETAAGLSEAAADADRIAAAASAAAAAASESNAAASEAAAAASAASIGPDAVFDSVTTDLITLGGANIFAIGARTILNVGSGTYNTPANARALRVRGVAGGGGGGGIAVSSAGAAAISSGGSGGGYFDLWIENPAASYTYTIGAGGAGGTAGNNVGSDGGDTTWSDGTNTATGVGGRGGAGHGGTAGTGGGSSRNGGSADIGTFTNGIAIRGGACGWGRVVVGDLANLPLSGGSVLGFPVDSSPYTSGAVDNTVGYGGGGGAVYSTTNPSTGAGGAGGGGVIIVEVYY